MPQEFNLWLYTAGWDVGGWGGWLMKKCDAFSGPRGSPLSSHPSEVTAGGHADTLRESLPAWLTGGTSG